MGLTKKKLKKHLLLNNYVFNFDQIDWNKHVIKFYGFQTLLNLNNK